MNPINIKAFVSKVTAMDKNQGRSVILSPDEARAIRDEMVNLMAENYKLMADGTSEPVTIEIVGGKF